MSPPKARLAAAAFGAASIVLTARAADACFWVDCGNADLRAGPANVGVLVHVADARQKTTTPAVVLRDGTGNDVSFSIEAEGHAPGVWLLRPSTPLAAGTRVTADVASCPSMEAKTLTLSAQLVPVAAEPTAAGTITAGAPRPANADELAVLGCGTSGTAVARAVDVRLAPHPSLEPYLPITTLEIRIDGQPYVDLVRRLPAVGAFDTSLLARCDAPGGLAPTEHDLEIRAWIPDRGAPLTATAKIDLSCHETSATPATPEPYAAGCGIGRDRRVAGDGALLGAAVLGALIRRRRRRAVA